MDLNPAIKIKSNFFLFAPVIVIIAGLVLLLATTFSAAGSKSNSSCSKQQTSLSQESSNYSSVSTSCEDTSPLALVGILGFYLAIFISAVLFVIWEWSYSHGVATITDQKLSFAIGLVILVLVPDGIDILILQDYFNKVGEPAATPLPVAPAAV